MAPMMEAADCETEPEPPYDEYAEVVLHDALAAVAAEADRAIVDLDFLTGITAVKSFIDLVNGYVTEQAPWVLAKDPANDDRLHTVLYTICESLRAVAVLYNPLMPKAMSSLWNQLGAEAQLGPIGEQRITVAGTWGGLQPGAIITKGDSLFPRIEEVA